MTIALDEVTVARGGRRVLGPVSCVVPSGALTAVVGPNGAGKSTLLAAISGLIAHRGRVAVDGDEVARLDPTVRARRIAYLPQSGTIAWPVSVRSVVALGRLPHGADPALLKPRDDAAIDRALASADLVGLADRPVDMLSGGERARVLLARALAVEAPVLVVDEPAAALDVAHRLDLYGHLAAHARAGGTVVAAIHDLDDAVAHADHLVVLDRGTVVASGAPLSALSEAVLAEVFGVLRIANGWPARWLAVKAGRPGRHEIE